MSIKEMIQKAFLSYFVLFTFITAVIMILGRIFDPNACFGYDAFKTPFIYTTLGIIPIIVMYSSKELTTAQFIIRKLIQLIIIEAEILAVSIKSSGINTDDSGIVLSIMLSVFVIFAAVNLISVFNNYFTAKKMTNELIDFQKNKIRE